MAITDGVILEYTGQYPSEGIQVEGTVYRGVDSPVAAKPEHVDTLLASGVWKKQVTQQTAAKAAAKAEETK